jgi:hypothetical protein
MFMSTKRPFTPPPVPQNSARAGATDQHWAYRQFENSIQILGELAEMGLDLAAAIERHGAQPGGAGLTGRAALAYQRVLREVQLTVAQQARTA